MSDLFVFMKHFVCFFSRGWREGQSRRQRSQRGRGLVQRLPALPAGLRLLQGRHAVRGQGGRRPAAGRALLPVPLPAHRLRQHGAHLPLPEEQGNHAN